jgi:hypothetical protein
MEAGSNHNYRIVFEAFPEKEPGAGPFGMPQRDWRRLA